MRILFLLGFCALVLANTPIKPHAKGVKHHAKEHKVRAKTHALAKVKAPTKIAPPVLAQVPNKAARASTDGTSGSGKTCTISSWEQCGNMAACSSIVIQGQTVPAGKGLSLTNLADGTTVTLTGTLTFAPGKLWSGTLLALTGGKIVFDGQGNTFDGSGAYYWDELGTNSGGRPKPVTAIFLQHSGIFKNLIVKNAPSHGFGVSSPAALTISGVVIDNSAGAAIGPHGKALGHNTDGFDVFHATDLTITDCIIENQDDCFALTSGTNIVFSNNVCKKGHGISLGSIRTGSVVNGVTISNNKIIDSENGLRIKTYQGATQASIKNVVYRDNHATGCTKFGVIIVQDYVNGGETGKEVSGVAIEDVSFLGQNIVEVIPKAVGIKIRCAPGDCKGTWDWSGLEVSGTSLPDIDVGDAPVTGFSLSLPGKGYA